MGYGAPGRVVNSFCILVYPIYPEFSFAVLMGQQSLEVCFGVVVDVIKRKPQHLFSWQKC